MPVFNTTALLYLANCSTCDDVYIGFIKCEVCQARNRLSDSL